jgi:Zn-dependent peptidase ImmA (M78 family)
MPLSREKIRNVAKKVRQIAQELTGKDPAFFEIVKFLDVTLPEYIEEYSLEVLEADQMGDFHGHTIPDEHTIEIRSDVYKRAYERHGRDRMTMAHELGHYVLHSKLGMARMMPRESIKPYRSSEWQANAFAGELLISAEHISQCSNPTEACSLFGVTMDAAVYQWNIFKREGIVR